MLLVDGTKTAFLLPIIGPLLPTLTEIERAQVAETWAFRARSEREATGRFQWFANILPEVDSTDIVVQMANQAIEDEQRHALLCDSMVARFGGPEETYISRGPLPLPVPKELPLREQVLHAMVAFCCVTESLNASMLVATLQFTECPEVKSAVQQILKDEVQHSRMGWAHLAAEGERGIGFLSDYLGSILLDAGVREIFDETRAVREGAALMAYGELDFEKRTDIFKAAMRDVIWPGFESLGINTAAGKSALAPYS